MLFSNPASGRNCAKDPAVVSFRGRYLLYHSVPPTPAFNGWTIGIAESRDLVHWEIIGQLLPQTSYEQNGLCAPGAIVLTDRVHLFYQTYGNGARDAICHAVSDDGLHFERNPENPVFSPAPTWCCGRAIDADVCLFGGRLLMYFATRDHEMKIQKLGGAWADPASRFGKADFHPLARHTLLHPELKWEGSCIEAPATLVHGGRIFLFYGGSYNCTPQQIGCAVSDDGTHFERLSDAPLLTNGPAGPWNACESGHPFAFHDPLQDRDLLFYQGSPDNGNTWYISKAAITFEGGVPALSPDPVTHFG